VIPGLMSGLSLNQFLDSVDLSYWSNIMIQFTITISQWKHNIL
jgi:hypothetical protein